MRHGKSLLLISSACAVLALSGCATGPSHEGERTAGRMVDDHSINSQVKADLDREPVYKFSDVDVKTFNGVVQLSGFVNTEDQRRRAAEIAQGVSGVAQVVNSIALKPQQVLTPTGRVNPNQPAPVQTVPPK